MDLALSNAQRRTVDDARAWLLDLLPADYEERAAGYRADLEFRRRYQRAAYEAGWLAPGAAAELGGRGLDPITELLVKVQFARMNAPKLPNVQGPGVVAPALLRFGTPAQREHAIPVLRGDEWWCLGMSEPDAGSDLAGLRTAARPDGDGFVIAGQKTWTSHAAASGWCLLFARTDIDGAPHRGITAFVVPMADPRIAVHPIAKLGAGDEEFCDVFFERVTVGPDALLGPLGGGWTVAMESLAHERDMIWIMNLVDIERCVAIAGDRASAALAERLERCAADAEALWLMGLRSVSARADGRRDSIGPMLKLFSSEALSRAVELACDAAGPESVLTGPGAPLGGYLAETDIEGIAAQLYGGTSEIQRNIVGERVLGLPRDGGKLP
jgi:alkylation response protein AidB-like acyl-CoA dehydrogenase